MASKKINWHKNLEITDEQFAVARTVLNEVQAGETVFKSIRKHPLSSGGYVAKHMLVFVYHDLLEKKEITPDPHLLAMIRMKPMRTLSGVTTVTVLTKPYPCPGRCIFCPNDVQLPKSYIREEPGAARAFQNNFDPYLQVKSRIESYEAIGHPTNKIELLILGGCWTAYPQDYQEWFVQRCFDAMNGQDSSNLQTAQLINQSGEHRNVGLVVETRPDEIHPAALVSLRKLGGTKVQIGAQSFDDRILALNHRGHTHTETLNAMALLRAAGFKIVLHWMPNLLGATLDSDREDFRRIWLDGYCPDEIKIYPTQLVESAELFQYWKRGEYQPYSSSDLIQLIADIKTSIPAYCRVNRIIRDIPANYIVAGNKRSSLRQDVLQELTRRGERCQCIRCREVRGQLIDPANLNLMDTIYFPADAEEHFINFTTPDDHLAGYLRLSISNSTPNQHMRHQVYEQFLNLVPELRNTAVIREVHVFGQALELGSEQEGAAQHSGLGTILLQRAEEITRQKGLKHLAVISAVGTRDYYRQRGFHQGDVYMLKNLE